jgi:putative SOS response-associated peptidase YedK
MLGVSGTFHYGAALELTQPRAPGQGLCHVWQIQQHYSWAEVQAFLDVFGTPRNLQPRYNIAPTTTIDAVRQHQHGRELVSMRWA